ncbi:MAG: thiolase domain-containing protein [Actinobacteria bacterium]|nr:thiolase domain-containing protein [Actinomycetota bacterium]
MRPVWVVGVSHTDFGVLKDIEAGALGARAAIDALADAGLTQRDIQVAYCGNATGGIGDPQANVLGQIALRQAGIAGIPVMRVENACSSGSCAFRESYMAVGSGMYDVALALGVEKMTGLGRDQTFDLLRRGSDTTLEGLMGITFPGVFAMAAVRHMAQFGTTREQIARVAVKNHRNAVRNPHAHFHKEISVADVLASPLVAEPLNLYDCCPTSDGAAAAILVGGAAARRLSRRAVRVAASVLASGTYENPDLVSFQASVRGAREAYERAGVSPGDVDLAEVHDCFTIAEIIHYEDLGLCAKGEGGGLIDSGATEIGGPIPVNPSGGLKAKGHPVGATGISQIYEVVTQLRGEAGERQVQGARVGLTHCMGGFINGDGASCAINILIKGVGH